MANTWTSPYNGFNPYQNPFASNSIDKSQADRMQLDWMDRQKLMEQQMQIPPSGPGGHPVGPAISPVSGPDAQTANRGMNTAEQLRAAATASTSGAQTANQLASTTNQLRQAGNGDSRISDNYTPKPGMYYSDVTPDNILSLIQDPSQAMGYWAKFHGYNDAYANRLSSVFNINDLLRAMGIGGTQMVGTNELDWQGRLADRLSGRLKDASGGGYDYLNPQSIAASIFNTPRAGLSSGANDLALSVNNPNLQPEQQITNVAQFVLGSLQGVLTNDQLNAYSQVLDQLATQFMRSYQTTPGGGSADRPTFLEYVRQNGGQYGGLF